MKLASHLTQRMLHLDEPVTRDVVVQKDLRVPMPDGVELLADRWAPRVGGESLPTGPRGSVGSRCRPRCCAARTGGPA